MPCPSPLHPSGRRGRVRWGLSHPVNAASSAFDHPTSPILSPPTSAGRRGEAFYSWQAFPKFLRRRLRIAPLGTFAFVRIEEAFAQTHGTRRHFHQLVILDVGDRLFQAHPPRRDQQHGVVLAGGTDVGEL